MRLQDLLFLCVFVHFEMVRLFAQPYGYTLDNSHLGIPYRDEWSVDLNRDLRSMKCTPKS